MALAKSARRVYLRQHEALPGLVEPQPKSGRTAAKFRLPCTFINPISTLFKHACICGAARSRTWLLSSPSGTWSHPPQ